MKIASIKAIAIEVEAMSKNAAPSSGEASRAACIPARPTRRNRNVPAHCIYNICIYISITVARAILHELMQSLPRNSPIAAFDHERRKAGGGSRDRVENRQGRKGVSG